MSRARFAKAAVCTLLVWAMLPGAAFAGAEYKKHKGLNFESSDGAFKVALGSRVQLRFTETDPEVGDGSGSFDVRRAKFSLKGTVYEHWKFKVQSVWSGSSTKLEDAYFQYAKNKQAQIWVGQGKVNFGRQLLTSSGKQQFVDRSIASGEFAPARSQGLALVGATDNAKLGYAVGVYDDFDGDNVRTNSDDNYMFTGRVVWTPLGAYKLSESSLDYPEDGRLAVGLKMLTDTMNISAGIEEDNSTVGVEVAYKIRGFNAVAEYFSRTLETTGSPDVDTDGGYLQLGYLFPNKKSEVAGRYAVIEPDTVGASMDRTETGFAYSHYFHAHDYKLQFDYRQLEFDATPAMDSNELRAQLQFVF